MTAIHACGYVLEFDDNGESEKQVLHVGSLEECEHVLELLPAVAYSGSRRIVGARLVIVEVRDEQP